MSVKAQNNSSIIGIDVSKHKLDLYINHQGRHLNIDNNEIRKMEFAYPYFSREQDVLSIGAVYNKQYYSNYYTTV